MIAVHTAQTLATLSWNDLRKVHSSLGLKAIGKRADYEARILSVQPQQVADIKVAAPLTCSCCPLARLIEDNRYCCQVSQTANDVKRGHWEATISCYEALAKAEAETEAAEPVVEVQASIVPEVTVTTQPVATATIDNDEPSNRGDDGRGRVEVVIGQPVKIATVPHAAPKADDNFMSSMVKEDELDKAFYDMTHLLECQLKAQLAVEKTIIGSDEEAIALLELEKVDRDIEFYGRLASDPQPSPVVLQLENQMSELKKDVLSLFKITAFDPVILPVCDDEPEQLAAQSEPEPEGTIYWHSPTTGTIVGKKGALRNFYLRKRNAFGHLEIMVIISSDFTAAEHKSPNIHHQRIRAAIEAGHTFNPKAFKNSPQFLAETEDYRGIGRIKEGVDGRWWAWVNGGITGQPFPCENLALKYLDRVAENQAQKQKVCAN